MLRQASHTLTFELTARNIAALAVCSLACTASALVWLVSGAHLDGGLLSVALIVAVIVANYVSLPIGKATRIWFASVPCFLIVALLPPPTAMVVMGLGIGMKELAVCQRCHNTAAQVAGQVGRWMFIALAASALSHTTNVLFTGIFLGIFLWVCDVLTAPLILSYGTVKATITRLFKMTWMDELMQYAMAYFTLPIFMMTRRDLMISLPALVLITFWMVLYLGLRRGETPALSLPEE